MALRRVAVATKINGIYESIISLLGSEVNSFDIVNADINDTSQLATTLESAQILVADPALFAPIELSCKNLQWMQVCWLVCYDFAINNFNRTPQFVPVHVRGRQPSFCFRGTTRT